MEINKYILFINNTCLQIKIKIPRLGGNQLYHLYSTDKKLRQRLNALPKVPLEACVRARTGVTCVPQPVPQPQVPPCSEHGVDSRYTLA